MALTRRTLRPRRKSLLSMWDSFCSGPRFHGARGHGALERCPQAERLAETTDAMAADCEHEKSGEVMTTMLAVRFNPRIGRRSELGPADGTMLRRRLIRSDEAWHDALTTSSVRSTLSLTALSTSPSKLPDISCRDRSEPCIRS